jgi:hypothetical protein
MLAAPAPRHFLAVRAHSRAAHGRSSWTAGPAYPLGYVPCAGLVGRRMSRAWKGYTLGGVCEQRTDCLVCAAERVNPGATRGATCVVRLRAAPVAKPPTPDAASTSSRFSSASRRAGAARARPEPATLEAAPCWPGCWAVDQRAGRYALDACAARAHLSYGPSICPSSDPALLRRPWAGAYRRWRGPSASSAGPGGSGHRLKLRGCWGHYRHQHRAVHDQR